MCMCDRFFYHNPNTEISYMSSIDMYKTAGVLYIFILLICNCDGIQKIQHTVRQHAGAGAMYMCVCMYVCMYVCCSRSFAIPHIHERDHRTILNFCTAFAFEHALFLYLYSVKSKNSNNSHTRHRPCHDSFARLY